MFGTKMTDEFFGVHTGGDIAFLNGVLKVLLADGGIDRAFVREHTDGFDAAARRSSKRESFADLEAAVGRDPRRHGALRPHVRGRGVGGARLVDGDHAARARRRQRHRDREPRARPRATSAGKGAGLMPIRGHSGVQGGSEMGAYATAFPGGVADRRGERRGAVGDVRLPDRRAAPGLTAEEMIEAARTRPSSTSSTRAAATSSTCCPIPTAVARRARAGPAARAPGHRRVEPDARRPGRGRRAAARRAPATSSATAAPRPPPSGASCSAPRSRAHGSARRAASGRSSPTSRRRVVPTARTCSTSRDADAVRDEIARVVPTYAGVEQLQKLGDAVQWGGTRLCADGVFPTPDGKAQFIAGRARGAASARPAASCSAPAAASSSTRWCYAERGPAHRRGPRRAASSAPPTPRR